MIETTTPGPVHGRATAGGEPLEVRPDGVVPLRRGGRAPFRVLLFGGGAMVGWGLLDHDRGLPGQIADGLVRATGHGIDLDVIVEVDPMGAASLGLLRGLRISRYDAVVVLLGEHAALEGTGRREFALGFDSLAAILHGESSKASPLFVFDTAQPMVAVSRTGLRRRRAMGGAAKLADVVRERVDGGRIRFDELAAPATVLGWGRQFSTTTLRDWGGDVAKAVAPALLAGARVEGPDTASAVRLREQDERYRQRAVDSMRMSARERDGLLDGIARQAKAHFRATNAFVNIVDGDRVWNRASTRSVLSEIPRALAFCDRTVKSDLVHIVNDTVQDPRFDTVPTVGGDPMAFYAGEPLHTVDGYRFGALCIGDAVPRAMRPDQLGELHALAGRIERELWASSLGARR